MESTDSSSLSGREFWMHPVPPSFSSFRFPDTVSGSRFPDTVGGSRCIREADRPPAHPDIPVGRGTPQQNKLFALMAEFVGANIIGWVSSVYDTYGREGVQSENFVLHILPHAEVYYDSCAAALYSRADAYLNRVFDAMMAIDLGVNTHPMDHLHFIVLIAARVMMDLRIPDLAIFKTLPRPVVTGASAFNAKRPQIPDISGGAHACADNTNSATGIRGTIMADVKLHIHELIQANCSLASDLRGCDHEHEPVSAGDKIFTFQVVPENMLNAVGVTPMGANGSV